MHTALDLVAVRRWLKQQGLNDLTHVPVTSERLAAAQIAVLTRNVEKLPAAPILPPPASAAAPVPAPVAGFAPAPAVQRVLKEGRTGEDIVNNISPALVLTAELSPFRLGLQTFQLGDRVRYCQWSLSIPFGALATVIGIELPRIEILLDGTDPNIAINANGNGATPRTIVVESIGLLNISQPQPPIGAKPATASRGAAKAAAPAVAKPATPTNQPAAAPPAKAAAAAKPAASGASSSRPNAWAVAKRGQPLGQEAAPAPAADPAKDLLRLLKTPPAAAAAPAPPADAEPKLKALLGLAPAPAPAAPPTPAAPAKPAPAPPIETATPTNGATDWRALLFGARDARAPLPQAPPPSDVPSPDVALLAVPRSVPAPAAAPVLPLPPAAVTPVPVLSGAAPAATPAVVTAPLFAPAAVPPAAPAAASNAPTTASPAATAAGTVPAANATPKTAKPVAAVKNPFVPLQAVRRSAGGSAAH